MNNEGRVVVWFSCGAASAVAAKLAVDKHEHVNVVYCNTLAGEHSDNRRFMRDVENWIGQSVEIVSSSKYETVDEVFSKRRFMSGPHGAVCTLEMKKIPRQDYQQPNDLHIFGLTADEGSRISQFEGNNGDLEIEWNLRDAGITKEGCYRALEDAGIELPAMYRLGFSHNNCIGCVKATSAAYWARVRKQFPAIYEKRAAQSREIGCRLANYQGNRVFLDELPEDNNLSLEFDEPDEDIECGVICITK